MPLTARLVQVGASFKHEGKAMAKEAANRRTLRDSLTVWVNAAVGMIGSVANPFNLLFGGVLVVALAAQSLRDSSPAGWHAPAAC